MDPGMDRSRRGDRSRSRGRDPVRPSRAANLPPLRQQPAEMPMEAVMRLLSATLVAMRASDERADLMEQRLARLERVLFLVAGHLARVRAAMKEGSIT